MSDVENIDEITLEERKNEDTGSPEPSHMMTGQYVVLMETNEKECESWMYFIRLAENREALLGLRDQLEKLDWYIEDDLSTFDIDVEHTVTAKTAKQMTKLELNSHSFHRKFDGKLREINLGFRKKDSNRRKMEKTFDLLGYGQIEDYISDEDLDPEDLTEGSSSDSSSDSRSSDSGASSDSEDKDKNGSKKHRSSGIPPALLNSDRPRWARHKGFRKKKP